MTIKNASSETIAHVDIVVSTAHITADQIFPGGSRDLPYSFRQESNYAIHVAFASGRVLVKNVGYVDGGGYTTHDVLFVTDDDVTDQTGAVSSVASSQPTHR